MRKWIDAVCGVPIGDITCDRIIHRSRLRHSYISCLLESYNHNKNSLSKIERESYWFCSQLRELELQLDLIFFSLLERISFYTSDHIKMPQIGILYQPLVSISRRNLLIILFNSSSVGSTISEKEILPIGFAFEIVNFGSSFFFSSFGATTSLQSLP